MSLPFKHLTSAVQLTPDVLETLFRRSAEMEEILESKKSGTYLDSRVVAVLFYESSTRTMLSFQSAVARLGGKYITAQGIESSSLKKGESIEDTMRVMEQYADAIVMRHPREGIADEAAAASSVPFINAGDGGNQHPTQALLDMYTIFKERGRLDNLHIAFGCDPKHSRTIRSLATVLSQYEGNTFTFISPDSLRMHSDLKDLLTERGIEVRETSSLEDGLDADVLYLNRLQEERFADREEFERHRHDLVLHADHLATRDTLVIDPLPRIDEIDTSVDALPNAAYFRQVRNGLITRMALLSFLVT